ncbi:MAG: MaoC family dehydratase N-terminal domain-containing protein [Chloroflexota bacterium]|nr:MaoC family dehydratase N-terminal domain-containing protein [Chloroflexota bacterium]
MSVLAEGRISNKSLEEFQRRVGTKLRIAKQNELASKEAIWIWARGIGDPNLLWHDEEYATKSSYGTIIASPSWLYSVCLTYVQQGLPGVHAFHSGNDWEFYKPVLLGDRIRPECIFTGFKEMPSKFAGKMVMEYQEARYSNQRDELVARAKSWLVRVERQAARSKGKYSQIQLPHPWKEEELEKVEEEILNEKARGSEIRYWEDVREGEELPPVIKGPLGLTDELAFFAGLNGSMLFAHGMALRYYRDHPTWGFRDPNTFAMEPAAGVHWNKHAASSAGLPDCYDIGIQRQSWLVHLLTNWMGDEGWLKRNYAEYRFFVYFSDVVWLRGKVTKKYVDENGEYCVDIETSARNQRGEETMPGRSTVILPSREAGTFPVRNRLSS